MFTREEAPYPGASRGPSMNRRIRNHFRNNTRNYMVASAAVGFVAGVYVTAKYSKNIQVTNVVTDSAEAVREWIEDMKANQNMAVWLMTPVQEQFWMDKLAESYDKGMDLGTSIKIDHV